MISAAKNLFITLVSGVMITSCSPITFPSAESLTAKGGVVFNEISWKTENGKDIWIMKQSHHGPDLPKKDWDEIRIIVQNGEVSYHQIKDGQEIPHKVDCLNCHANGPRAIRPHQKNDLTVGQKIQISLMNLKIKSYGALKTKNIHIDEKSFLREPLKLATCVTCHTDSGPLSRGFLTRQNAATIEYLVKNDLMPPNGGLNASDKKYLLDFIDGF